MKHLQKPGGMVTGVTDLPPVQEQVQLITELLPKAHRIGIIYNLSESNSVYMVDQFKQYAKSLAKPFEVIEAHAVTRVRSFV